MAHLGLRPQAVGLLGGYKFQGRTARGGGGDRIGRPRDAGRRRGGAAAGGGAAGGGRGRRRGRRSAGHRLRRGAGLPRQRRRHPRRPGADARARRGSSPSWAIWPARPSDASPSTSGWCRTGEYPAAEHNYVMPEAEKQRLLDGRADANRRCEPAIAVTPARIVEWPRQRDSHDVIPGVIPLRRSISSPASVDSPYQRPESGTLITACPSRHDDRWTALRSTARGLIQACNDLQDSQET